ncbi:hypothetical protein SDJN02_00699, partial [Cucurbita argyrosperma subsp. argyrosperma]
MKATILCFPCAPLPFLPKSDSSNSFSEPGDSSLHQSHLLPSRHSELSAASHLPPLVVYETAALALTLAIKQLSGGGCDSIGVCKSLKALSLWTRDESELEVGNFSQAEPLFLQLKLFRLLLSGNVGNHFSILLFSPIRYENFVHNDALYMMPCFNLYAPSIMKLAQRNHSGDLEDANEALGLHLQRYAFLTKDHFDSAATLYSTALKFDPSIRLQNHSRCELLNFRRDSVPCIHNKF